ncbi:hypothetical protein SAMN05216438_1135 [Lactococcus garvieae]|uniref:Uncharacterized protein n=2 Tax=Lactococcus garvieae TaxID=1363 RepID=A0A1I4I4F0_9LACT|nr:hypothetical protein SAMN05216438_1135 [Lactococcus garvieae]
MIVKDVYDLLCPICKIFMYHLPLNFEAKETFILLTETYSVRTSLASNVSHAKREEVQLMITYDDNTVPDELENKINTILESHYYYQTTGRHDYVSEIDKFQATLKYQKINFKKGD